MASSPLRAARQALALAALCAPGLWLHACATAPAPAAHVTAMSPPQQALHVLNRLGFGPAPGDLDRVDRIGVDAYIQEQLHPEALADPPELTARLQALPTLQLSDAELYAQYGPPARQAANKDPAALDAVKQRLNQVADEARTVRLLRALYSPAQLQEAMVDFWFNHFNVYIDKGQEDKLWTGAYEREAIRPYALAKFRDLLGATARHPAMLYYLDNWQSSARFTDRKGQVHGGLNENYARELMELHTLGVDGGYSQHDVTELARIFTGWTFQPRQLAGGSGAAFHFDGNRHDRGAKQFLGQSFPAGGGEDEGERALDLLARSPATAHHLALELAQYFVADQPPPALVQRLAQRFQDSGGDIRETLAALFASPEFWDQAVYGAKFKTPYQYVVSSLRASGLPMIANVRPLLGAMYQNGQPLYGCLTPDGYKNTQAAWLNPDTMIYRLNFANALGSGSLPLWRAPDPPPPSPSPSPMMGAMPAPSAAADPPPRPQPPDPYALQAALGNQFSLATVEALAAARPQLRAGLILGSPEFMRR